MVWVLRKKPDLNWKELASLTQVAESEGGVLGGTVSCRFMGSDAAGWAGS